MEMNKEILNKTRLKALSNNYMRKHCKIVCNIHTVGSFTEMSNQKSNLQIKIY